MSAEDWPPSEIVAMRCPVCRAPVVLLEPIPVVPTEAAIGTYRVPNHPECVGGMASNVFIRDRLPA